MKWWDRINKGWTGWGDVMRWETHSQQFEFADEVVLNI